VLLVRWAWGSLAVGLVGVLGAVACGPSFQAIYECDVRFEHCYALDQGVASVDVKKQCWREWLRGYTYGQSGDRIEYAAARFSELSLDPTLPSVEVRDGGAARRSASPMPTSAFAPPPNLVERPAGDASAIPGDGGGVVSEVVLRAPGAGCADGCASRWKACHEDCRGDACDACDKTYRACMPACFREEGPNAGGTRAVH
jgi:hypothetical protein